MKLGIKPEEVKQTPGDVLAQLNQADGNPHATAEKSAELFAGMRERLAHSGKDFKKWEKGSCTDT